MKSFYLSVFCISLFTFTYAQTATFDGPLHFHSELEKEAFELKGENLEEQLTQLLAVQSEMSSTDVKNAKIKIESHLRTLETKGVRKKKIKKATQIIFDLTHEQFLRKYEYYAEFHQIFANGVYNCVTASALYALIFDHFNIPYEIREIPGHVYVIAYPNTENIIVETTDPVNGIYSIDKKKYINQLVTMKIISKTEANTKSVNDLYQTYAEEEETAINMRQLVADLYYNAVAVNFEDEKYIEAYQFLQKGQTLYDKKSVEDSKQSILLQLATKADVEDLPSLKPMFMLLEYDDYNEAASDDIYNLNIEVSEKYLKENYQPEKYDKIYYYFMNNFDTEKHKELADKLRLVRYSQIAVSWTLQSKFEKAMLYLDSTYQYGPNNLQVRSQITNTILAWFGDLTESNYYENQAISFFEQLEDYNTTFPFLVENMTIQEMRVFGMTIELLEYVENEEMDKVETHLQKMVARLDSLPEKSTHMQSMVENFYREIYSQYLRDQDDDNAKLWLEKGLKQFPESELLLDNKKSFEEYLANKKKYEGKVLPRIPYDNFIIEN